MTDAPDARRRPAFLQRLAGLPWPARIGLELVACTAALLGLARATGYLPSEASAPRERITVARVDDWPEIKNGIPELRAARASAPQPPVAVPPARRDADAPARASDAPALASIGSPGLLEPRSTYSAPTLGSATPAPASAEPAVSPGAELSPASGSAAPEPVEPASAEEPRPVPLASVPSAGATDPRQDGADRASPESRDVQPARASVPDRVSTPPAADPRAKKKAEAKPAPRPERKRTASAAAAPQEVPAAPEPPAIESRPAEAVERTTVLGVPVPSGRKIKECLLEFRC